MSFQVVKLFIFVTFVSSFALAKPVCERLLNKQLIPLMGVKDEALTRGPDEGIYFVAPKDFLTHFETVTKELREMPIPELMSTFDDLIQIEQNNHGGLTGIRHAKFSAKILVEDMGKANEYKREDFPEFSDKIFEEMKASASKSPNSQRLFSNYFRNELSALMGTGVYPGFFKRIIDLDSFTRPIRIKMISDKMSPTGDFRIYTTLVQREVIRRLILNPRRFFAEAGIEYPQNDQILQKSMDDLVKLVYAP